MLVTVSGYIIFMCIEDFFQFCSLTLDFVFWCEIILGETTMLVPMMKHSSSWQVFIVALIIICPWVMNFEEGSLMEPTGIATFGRLCVVVIYNGHFSRQLTRYGSFFFSSCFTINLLQVSHIWWHARLELHTWWLFRIDSWN